MTNNYFDSVPPPHILKIALKIKKIKDIIFNKYDMAKSLCSEVVKTKGISFNLDKKADLESVQTSIKALSGLLSATAKKVLQPKKLGFNIIVFVYSKVEGQHERFIGQTNTEYRQFSPIFYENINKGHCEHGSPTVNHKVDKNTRFSSGSFLFYVEKNAELIFKVFHERYTVGQGISHVLLFQKTVLLTSLSSRFLLNLTSQIDASASGQLFGELSIDTKHSQKTCENNDSSDEFDDILVKLDNIDTNHSCNEVFNRVNSIATLFNKLIESHDNLLQNGKTLKPSNEKHNIAFSALPTNLHIQEYLCSMRETSSKDADILRENKKSAEDSRSFYFVSSGVPSGIGLAHSSLVYKDKSLQTLYTELFNMKVITNTKELLTYFHNPKLLLSKLSSLLMSSTDIQSVIYKAICFYVRFTLTFSQAISIISANVMSQVQYASKFDRKSLDFRNNDTFYIFFESLLSCFSKELKMLEDFNFIMDFIEEYVKVQIILASDGLHVTYEKEIIKIELSKDNFHTLFNSVAVTQLNYNLNIIAFTQGVNEVQSLANLSKKLKDNTGKLVKSLKNLHKLDTDQDEVVEVAEDLKVDFQKELNMKGLKKLFSLVSNHNKFRPILTKLADVISLSQDTKTVDIFHLSNQLIFHLLGVKSVFCKSGKDRTAMAISFEQCSLLRFWYQGNSLTTGSFFAEKDEAEVQDQDLLSFEDTLTTSRKISIECLKRLCQTFREVGVRIQVANKNVGRPLYSFNRVQVEFLPVEFRPPHKTIQDLVLSIKARDS